MYIPSSQRSKKAELLHTPVQWGMTNKLNNAAFQHADYAKAIQLIIPGDQ